MNQNMTALAKGNAIRIEMADIKKGIRSGELDPVEVVQMCELPLPVIDFLKCLPRVGPTKALKAMRSMDLHERHTLGGTRKDGRNPITDEQRIKLAEFAGWQITPTARHGWRDSVAA